MTASGQINVFISYAHESAEHVDLVRDLWALLRDNGVAAKVDLPAAERPRDWTAWMLEQIRDAEFVLVVASEAYRRRSEAPVRDIGRGVQFEARLVREAFYRDPIAATAKFLPVLLPGASIEHIPEFMGPTSCTSYSIGEMSLAGVETLLRVLTAQPWEVEPPLGTIPILAPRTTWTVEGRAKDTAPRRDPAPGLADRVAATFSRWANLVARELLDPVIERADTATIGGLLRDDSVCTVLVSGPAGAGKSGVLHQLAAALTADDWPVLALRLDRLESSGSATELGERLGLPTSPPVALAAVADGRPSLLVIDQLDAVSLSSGRMIGQFDPIEEILQQAHTLPNMRVLLACRRYDIDNDPRLRALASDDRTHVHELSPLDRGQIAAAVHAMGLTPTQLTPEQWALLATPLHLVLLHAVSDEEHALGFRTTMDLLEAFYHRKERVCRASAAPRPVQFAAVVDRMAQAMSERQRLSVPIGLLDAHGLAADADLLASEHVLIADGSQRAFFHESFFDFAFARRWVGQGTPLRSWLLAGDQELFRRSQLRQILVHQRDADPRRFVADVRACLIEPAVRFHLKDVILSVLRALPDPSEHEWALVEELHTAEAPFPERVWGVLSTQPWFLRADAHGAVAAWLGSSDPDLVSRGTGVAFTAAAQHPERVAELLDLIRDPRAHGRALLRALRNAPRSDGRALLDRVLVSIHKGEHDDDEHGLFMTLYPLHDTQPDWTVELVHAWLAERPVALATVGDGRSVAALTSRDHGLLKAIGRAAAGAPEAFVRLLLPYMLNVMACAAREGAQAPIEDRHFSSRSYERDAFQADHALLHAMADALHALGTRDPASLHSVVSELLTTPFDAAQWLAYGGLIPVAAEHATWVADTLLEGEHRLRSGYNSNEFWTTRELLQAISEHIDDRRFRSLQAAAMAPATDDESDYSASVRHFTLLSALPSARLSDSAAQRLAELRQQFAREQPEEPYDIFDLSPTSPVDSSTAEAYTDEDWLAAIRQYSDPREQRFSDDGDGADMMSRIVAEHAKRDPARFGALALRLQADDAWQYGSSLLQALGDPQATAAPDVTFRAIRHIASLGHVQHDRWLSMPIRRLVDEDVPDEIILLLLDRALRSPDPADPGDPWRDATPRQRASLSYGLNTARGSASLALGDLLIRDVNGHRTALVRPHLETLASDPSVPVRACVAHLLSGALRHARLEATAAFSVLVAPDDWVLDDIAVQRLCIYLGNHDPACVVPVIRRALHSTDAGVRRVGGGLAAFAALDWSRPDLLKDAITGDSHARQGVAHTVARRLPFARDSTSAEESLLRLFNDEDPDVRREAAWVAAALRDERLGPHAGLLEGLIASPAFPDSLAQLNITLEHAPDRVNHLVDLVVTRFLTDMRGELANEIAADSHGFIALVTRWYAQANTVAARGRVLDLVDQLLLAGAYGAADIVAESER